MCADEADVAAVDSGFDEHQVRQAQHVWRLRLVMSFRIAFRFRTTFFGWTSSTPMANDISRNSRFFARSMIIARDSMSLVCGSCGFVCSWDKHHFPTPRRMIDDLAKRGTSISILVRLSMFLAFKSHGLCFGACACS
jgi:hypothetical protein